LIQSIASPVEQNLIMMENNPNLSAIKRIAFVGNHLPRQCGIAPFTTDLEVIIWLLVFQRYPHEARW
ncbi:MAG: hypothetical protein PVH18_12700, partial [Chloroflexota bacterium]